MAQNKTSERLDRIEEKIDKMVEVVISIARAEEKIVNLSSFSKQQSTQIFDIINRLETLEITVTKLNSTIGIMNRLFWIIITASVATAAAYMSMTPTL